MLALPLYVESFVVGAPTVFHERCAWKERPEISRYWSPVVLCGPNWQFLPVSIEEALRFVATAFLQLGSACFSPLMCRLHLGRLLFPSQLLHILLVAPGLFALGLRLRCVSSRCGSLRGLHSPSDCAAFGHVVLLAKINFAHNAVLVVVDWLSVFALTSGHVSSP